MAKKGARVQVTLEHKCEQGVYRYHTVKNMAFWNLLKASEET